jgi:hypothetical protein
MWEEKVDSKLKAAWQTEKRKPSGSKPKPRSKSTSKAKSKASTASPVVEKDKTFSSRARVPLEPNRPRRVSKRARTVSVVEVSSSEDDQASSESEVPPRPRKKRKIVESSSSQSQSQPPQNEPKPAVEPAEQEDDDTQPAEDSGPLRENRPQPYRPNGDIFNGPPPPLLNTLSESSPRPATSSGKRSDDVIIADSQEGKEYDPFADALDMPATIAEVSVEGESIIEHLPDRNDEKDLDYVSSSGPSLHPVPVLPASVFEPFLPVATHVNGRNPADPSSPIVHFTSSPHDARPTARRVSWQAAHSLPTPPQSPPRRRSRVSFTRAESATSAVNGLEPEAETSYATAPLQPETVHPPPQPVVQQVQPRSIEQLPTPPPEIQERMPSPPSVPPICPNTIDLEDALKLSNASSQAETREKVVKFLRACLCLTGKTKRFVQEFIEKPDMLQRRMLVHALLCHE